MIQRVASSSGPSAGEDLNRLFEIYDRPVLAFIKRSGFRDAEADDLKQEFLLALHRGDLFAAADQSKGRFRAFLVTLLDRFIIDHLRRIGTQKRGGGRVVSLEGLPPGERRAAEPVNGQTPYDAYQREWLRVVIENAMTKLRTAYARTGQAEYFEALAPYIRAEGETGQASIAGRFGKALGTVKSDVSRLRRKCGYRLMQEVAITVDDTRPKGLMSELLQARAFIPAQNP